MSQSQQPGPKPPGPWSSWDEDTVGARAQSNYKFLEALWTLDKDGKSTVRDKVLACQTEPDLRAYLASWNIMVPGDVRLVVFDIESSTAKSFINDPLKEAYYTLVLPPALRRATHDAGREDYREAQAYAGAWYHATSDGYGM